MFIQYSVQVSQPLRDRFEKTDACKNMVTSAADHARHHGKYPHYVVEYARELDGWLEAWLFEYSDSGHALAHTHVTVKPDGDEVVVKLSFTRPGADRFKVTGHHHAAG